MELWKLFSGLYICNLLKCLTKEKVMGEIFEDQKLLCKPT
jgi:hypothetical protein